MFKRWSEKDSDARKLMSPDLELRGWNELSNLEKEKMFQFLRPWFDSEENSRVFFTALKLNEAHKTKAYASRTLEDMSESSAKYDFENIFNNEDGHVVLEMLSIYAENIIEERSSETGNIRRYNFDSEEQYRERLLEWRWAEFDKFAKRLNDVFEQFGINLLLSRQGFISKQEEKITEEIYVPVIKALSSGEWKEVNRELRDSLQEYQRNTDQGYSNSITHSISAVQAFLQIIVDGEIGGNEGISALIKRAQAQELIPDDKFTETIFKNIDAILMRERGLTGDAHPKKEYANEKNARLVMNLVMVFIQHCLQN
jgi:hypothetical protein